MSHDSRSIEIEVYNNGKTFRLLELVFFTYKGAGILQTSTCIYITQRVLATPTLIGPWFYEYHYCLTFTRTTHIYIYIYIHATNWSRWSCLVLCPALSVNQGANHIYSVCKEKVGLACKTPVVYLWSFSYNYSNIYSQSRVPSSLLDNGDYNKT